MRVLGVDPGLTRCGVGVVDGEPGRTCRLVTVEVITTDPAEELGRRLLALDEALTRVVATYAPDAVAVERVFSQHNVRTVMGTAQAGAVAVLAGARAGLPVQTYTPSEVKASVTGSGQADKAQVTAMVMRLLRLNAAPRPPDAADALALAICHVWRGGAQARIAEARLAQQRRLQGVATASGHDQNAASGHDQDAPAPAGAGGTHDGSVGAGHEPTRATGTRSSVGRVR